jgi:hypothetical protein
MYKNQKEICDKIVRYDEKKIKIDILERIEQFSVEMLRDLSKNELVRMKMLEKLGFVILAMMETARVYEFTEKDIDYAIQNAIDRRMEEINDD